MITRVGLALLLCAVACGPTHHTQNTDAGADDDGGGPHDGPVLPHTLQTLSVTPSDQIVQLDLNATGEQAYSVIGQYADGTSEDLTSQVTLTVSDPTVGSFNGTMLEIPAFSAATAVTATVTASLGEVTGLAQITVVAYRQSGEQQDFFFILPYTDPNGPQDKPLAFSTAVPALDVFFLMDTTGSMAGEIHNLQTALNSTVIPGISSAVTNSEFGVGALEDFPNGTNGSTDCPSAGINDQPIKVLTDITNVSGTVTAAVNNLSTPPGNGNPIGCGNDTPEGGIEAIYQAATGQGLSSPAPTSVPADHTGIGGVGFRQGTMPVVVTITDAASHAKDEPGACSEFGFTETLAYAGATADVAHSRQDAKDALNGICARMVGIAAITSYCDGLEYLTDIATATGTRVPPGAWDVGTRPAGCGATQCCTGQNGVGVAADADGLCPVVFQVDTSGNGVSQSIVTGIQMLTRFATFDVTSERDGLGTDTSGNPLPASHTTADFIKMVTPTSFVLPPPPPALPTPTFDATTFHTVTPGTQVSFAVDAFNDFVPQTDQAQIFRATIKVLAGGCTALDQRDVLILVPPTPIILN